MVNEATACTTCGHSGFYHFGKDTACHAIVQRGRRRAYSGLRHPDKACTCTRYTTEAAK